MTTRQEMYDRIRESSRDEVILEEMIRLGFWPKETGQPGDPAEEIRRRGELERELRTLTTENRRLQNVDALKKAARKRRMAESRQRQKENKERRVREREERATAWKLRKQSELVYLGDGVSGGLGETAGDDAKLGRRSLPVFSDVAGLASAMEVGVGELRFLAFSRRTSTTTHYRRFGIRKKTGGVRQISAPMPRLKRAQEWILANILEKVELHRAAHGFRRGRSIVTNATPHVGADVVINVDVRDFFPTVTYQRVRGVFRSLGYSEQIATILGLICSEPDVDTLEIDNRTYYVSRSERYLPQGAPSSPAITNIICRGLDARLARTAEQLGFTYTRYADDITFSGSGDALDNIGRALRRIDFIVAAEGFQLHPDKTRVLRKARRQEVTGLVVNDRIAVPRDTLRRFRAVLFQIERDGPAGKRWGTSGNVIASIEGFANFVAMVDSEKGAALQTRVRTIVDRHGRGPSDRLQRPRWHPRTVKTSEPTDIVFPENAAPAKQKRPWWKFW